MAQGKAATVHDFSWSFESVRRMAEADRLTEEARAEFKVVVDTHKVCVSLASTVAARSRAAASAAKIARRASRMMRRVYYRVRRDIRERRHEVDALEFESWCNHAWSHKAGVAAKREAAAVARKEHMRSVAKFNRAVARYKKAQRRANGLDLDARKARSDALEWSAPYLMAQDEEEEEDERCGHKRRCIQKRSREEGDVADIAPPVVTKRRRGGNEGNGGEWPRRWPGFDLLRAAAETI